MDIDNATAVTRGLQGWCYAIAIREHFAVATAALVVGLESQVPSIYRRQYPVLLEKYGFTEEEAEFFDLHITSDEIHGERGYQIVLEHATRPSCRHAACSWSATAPRRASRTPRRSTTPTSRRNDRCLRVRRSNPRSPDDLRRGRRCPPSASRQPAARSPSPKATRSTCCASRSATIAASRSSAQAATAAPIACAWRRARRTACPCDDASASASPNWSTRAIGWRARRTSTATSRWRGIPSRSALDEGSRVYDKLKQVWLAKDDSE